MRRLNHYSLLLTIALSLPLFTGCSHQYVMKTSGGMRITSMNKPKLQHGYWKYKDAQGREQHISAGRVLEVAPASMAGDENSKFKAPSPK